MTEQNQNQNDSNDKDNDDGEKIELDVNTYNALLDRLDELEGKGNKGNKDDKDDLDDLYDEGTNQRDSNEKEPELDRMSGTELAQYISDQFTDNALNPITIKLAEVALELDAMKLEAKEGYGDYREHEKSILSYLHKHPTLSLKEGYDQVVGKPKVNEKKESDKESNKSDNPLRHLPPRKAIHGEKPTNVAASNVNKKQAMDTRSAAAKAIDELNVNF